MPALQVRDFPQDLYDKLKIYSEREHRSMSQQVIVAVEKMLTPAPTRVQPVSASRFELESEQARQERIEERKRLFEEIDALRLNIPDDLPDSLTLIHEAREERMAQIMSNIDIPEKDQA